VTQKSLKRKKTLKQKQLEEEEEENKNCCYLFLRKKIYSIWANQPLSFSFNFDSFSQWF
jgi:hypothetical protein